MTAVLIFVAPLVGAWIEIFDLIITYHKNMSLLSWERGLKFRNITTINLM